MCTAVIQRRNLKRPFKFLKHTRLTEIAYPGKRTFITPYILHYFNLEEGKCRTLTIRFPI